MTDQPPDSKTKPENREMYAEIAALVGAVAKAFAIPEAEATAALENGTVTLDFGRDANGNRYVAATRSGQTVRLYQGAIKHSEPPARA